MSWELSNSLSVDFCILCLEQALHHWDKPVIFNSDQGCQFTRDSFTKILENEQIRISRDGKGRALDNVLIERFWRSLKYECIYISSFEDGKNLYEGLEKYIYFYNFERKHQALNYLTPADIYLSDKGIF